jgi:hypothetical protein
LSQPISAAAANAKHPKVVVNVELLRVMRLSRLMFAVASIDEEITVI